MICYEYNNLSMIAQNILSQIDIPYNIIKVIQEVVNKIVLLVSFNNKKYIIKIKTNYHKHEREIYDKLILNKHPNIENIVNYYLIDPFLIIVSEYIDGILINNINYAYIKDILHGLEFIHNLGIIHCDLKIENIITTDKCIIIDFDNAHMLPNTDTYIKLHNIGTLRYIAPECYNLGLYSCKSDIWSLGVCCYLLLTGRFPYECPDKCINLYIKNSFKDLDKLDSNLFDIIKYMLIWDDDNRYTIPDLKKLV